MNKDPKTREQLEKELEQVHRQLAGLQALQSSGQALGVAFDSMKDYIHIVDPTLKIVFMNKSFKQWNKNLGFKQDVEGLGLFDVFPFLSDKVRDEYKKVFDAGDSLITQEITRVNGKDIITETQKIPIIIEGKVIEVITIIRDIADYKLIEKAFIQEKHKLAGVTDSVGCGLLLLDNQTRIIYSNRLAQQWLGTIDQIKGKSCCQVFGLAKEECVALEVLRKGQMAQGESFVRVVDGQQRCFYIVATPLKDSDGNIQQINEVIIDITARKDTEGKLLRAAHEWRTTFDSLTDLMSIHDKDFNITRVNKAFAYAFGMEPKDVIGKKCYEIFHETRMPLANCPHKQTIDTTDTITREFYEPRLKIHVEVTTSPIFDEKGEVTGSVHIAKDISSRKKTQEALQRSLKSFEKLSDQISGALASAVEKRDPYTAGHQQRVAQLVFALAKQMGFSENVIKGIYMTAVLHDIGKIYVPAELLSKPGKLTAVEFELIKTHAQVGYDILRTIEFQWPIAQIVLQHHERINGSGYPQGLSDKEILLEAKILAVADVVEAMASHRPYRPALGIDIALEEIKQKRGILYEPKVVDACLSVFNEGKFRFT